VKEMRLNGISDIAAAQAFAPRFIALWNAKFAVAPRQPSPAHRPWSATPDALDEALARREERVLSKGLTFRSPGQLHAVKTSGPGTALTGARVSLHHFLDGTLRVRYKDRILSHTAFGVSPAPAPAEDEKTLDSRLDAIVAAIAVTASKAAPRLSQNLP
jgi:hypothetical protein